jgi:hypothetical protein
MKCRHRGLVRLALLTSPGARVASLLDQPRRIRTLVERTHKPSWQR